MARIHTRLILYSVSMSMKKEQKNFLKEKTIERKKVVRENDRGRQINTGLC